MLRWRRQDAFGSAAKPAPGSGCRPQAGRDGRRRSRGSRGGGQRPREAAVRRTGPAGRPTGHGLLRGGRLLGLGGLLWRLRLQHDGSVRKRNKRGGKEGPGLGPLWRAREAREIAKQGTRRWRAGGAPRCQGWIEKTAARGSAARRKGRGDLAGRWKARGREPAWSACASLGGGEREERGRKRRRGRGAGERRQAAGSGKERRLEPVDLAGQALAAQKKPRRRSAHL